MTGKQSLEHRHDHRSAQYGQTRVGYPEVGYEVFYESRLFVLSIVPKVGNTVNLCFEGEVDAAEDVADKTGVVAGVRLHQILQHHGPWPVPHLAELSLWSLPVLVPRDVRLWITCNIVTKTYI